ncbi:restriction endonuclease subunit S [Oceanobacillus manasiensis]|uniref:restriction endonuclease subunit S n=1 Tax=Oceanobacillus manasiensis TaxID=586413 RepID=UPI0006943E76|nr:restriction endonuclease subunit S [Oceanobacillus manasiensis]
MLPVNENDSPSWELMEQHSVFRIAQVRDKWKSLDLNPIIDNRDLGDLDWKEFYLNQVFDTIKRGKRLTKARQKTGLIPYVSSSMLNNGVDNFISNKNGVRKFKNALTLANSGSVGSSFFQPTIFIASDHVTVLKNTQFNKYHYLFLSVCIEKQSGKYSFNREINDARIKREKIMLPVNSKNDPDYEFMEQYMKRVENKIIEITAGKEAEL